MPQGHYKSTTLTAALRADGLAATTLFDGATTGTRFCAYLADTLVPVNAATGAAQKAAGSLAQAATEAQKVGDGIQGTVTAVEAAAVTIMDMSPVNARAAEIQARAIARETGLVMLTGLAPLIVCAGAAAWRFALTL